MPNRDGTGRNGEGARTGRGLGDCPKEERLYTKSEVIRIIENAFTDIAAWK